MDIAAAFEPITTNHAARSDPGDEDTFEPTAPPPDAEPPVTNGRLGRYSQRWAYLALQLQGIFEVSLLRHGLMASSPGGPGDDERRLDPALR